MTVRALLESDQLILRGAIRQKIFFSELQQVRVSQDRLIFSLRGEEVRLTLGSAAAATWCRIITSPPVPLTRKLGITPKSLVWQLGHTPVAALESALATARGVQSDSPDARNEEADLIVACIDSPAALTDVLQKTSAYVNKGVPIWILYPKGKGHAVNEGLVLSTARLGGLVDTKVASICSTHTGLRFIRRK